MMAENPMAQVTVRGLEEVIATVGYMPAALIGALHEANFDFMSHHRKSVIGHNTAPDKRRFGRMIATRLHRYGATTRNPTRLDELQGESYAAPLRSDKFGGLDDKHLRALEEGGNVNSREAMAIPIAAGLQARAPGTRPTPLFAKALKAWHERRGGNRKFARGLQFDVVRTSTGQVLLVLELDARRGKNAVGARTQVMGVLKRRRRQRAMLGFYAQVDRIQPKHEAKYERIIEQASTAAGQAALERRTNAAVDGRRAFQQAFTKYLDANPGNNAGARKAGEIAAREARKLALAPRGKV